MERNFKGTFNRVLNGDFLIESEDHLRFPEDWLQIGGNHETSWEFGYESSERPVVDINNATAIRAGIIQTLEASLDVGKNKDWQIWVLMKGGMPELQSYLRIYPIRSNGDVAIPWEFSFKLRSGSEKIKQVISVGPEVVRLRLETGVLGSGHLYIYKLIAYPLFPDNMKRRVKKVKKEICAMNHIQTIGEIVKPIQLAMPIPLKIPVTVQANVNADVRNLTPTRDRVQIHGSSQAPLATSSCGRAQVEIFGHGFHESLEDVTANQTMLVTTTRDVSALPRYSFAVFNFGTLMAYVQEELSPDGVHWALVGEQRKVGAEKLVIISPVSFLRYTRISYWADGITKLRIWVQAQN